MPYFFNQSLQPLRWVPSLYFMQGLPAAVVIQLSVILYKQLGLTNLSSILISSLLILPWVLKVVFAAAMERHLSKRTSIIVAQSMLACLFVALIILLSFTEHLHWSILALAGIGFAAAMNDIATDGFTLMALSLKEQAHFMAIKIFAYHCANLLVTSGILFTVSLWSPILGTHFAWQAVLSVLVPIIALLAYYHHYRLPMVAEPQRAQTTTVPFSSIISAMWDIPDKYLVLSFVLLFEAARNMLVKIIPLFFIDDPMIGGLGLTTYELAAIYGTIGSACFILGAVLCGWFIIRTQGLHHLTRWAVICSLSTLIFSLLSYFSGKTVYGVALLYGVYQLIGGVANGLYLFALLTIANRAHYKTTCYAGLSSLMLASTLFFGALSGVIEKWMGYFLFFCCATLLSGVAVLVTLSFKKTVIDYANQAARTAGS